MPMTPSAATDLFRTLQPTWEANRTRVEKIDKWYRGDHDKPQMPANASPEYRQLAARAGTPWLERIVTAVAQVLYVEGYRREKQSDNAKAWARWQANGMDARQIAVHRGALAHGLSYVTVLPGTDPFTSESRPMFRGRSARRMIAVYEDEAHDEWPVHALSGKRITGADGTRVWRYELLDADAAYTLDGNSLDDAKFIEYNSHDSGVCPVVRFTNSIDLDGRVRGEVAPFIPLAARIDQDVFDRLVVQRFGAFVVRWATGMAEPETDAEKRAAELILRVGDLLVNESPDARFGTLEATPLDGYIRAHETDIQALAAVSQTPAHDLVGQLVNLSAEALAAAEAGLQRKSVERQHMFGESWEQVLRLGAHLDGDTEGAADFAAEVRWRDMESRSLAQAADALGKLATMLGVPPQALWEKIPGVTQTDVERWAQMASEQDELAELFRQLAAEPAAEAGGGGLT